MSDERLLGIQQNIEYVRQQAADVDLEAAKLRLEAAKAELARVTASPAPARAAESPQEREAGGRRAHADEVLALGYGGDWRSIEECDRERYRCMFDAQSRAPEPPPPAEWPSDHATALARNSLARDFTNAVREAHERVKAIQDLSRASRHPPRAVEVDAERIVEAMSSSLESDHGYSPGCEAWRDAREACRTALKPHASRVEVEVDVDAVIKDWLTRGDWCLPNECVADLRAALARPHALRAEFDAEFVDVVFDGPPSHESGRFVEVENPRGQSINAGEWIDRGNGLWALRIARPHALATRVVEVDLDELYRIFRRASAGPRSKLEGVINNLASLGVNVKVKGIES